MKTKTLKGYSENVKVQQLDKDFNTRDYEVLLNELGCIHIIDWMKRASVAFHPSKAAKVKVEQYNERFSGKFVSVAFKDRSNGNGDRVSTFMTYEQARELRDQLNALDI